MRNYTICNFACARPLGHRHSVEMAAIPSRPVSRLVYSDFDMRALAIPTLVLAAASLWPASASAAQIPRQSPDFAIQLASGKQIKVSDYRGKVLCLTFILTTCPHCQKTTQLLAGMYPDLAPEQPPAQALPPAAAARGPVARRVSTPALRHR